MLESGDCQPLDDLPSNVIPAFGCHLAALLREGILVHCNLPGRFPRLSFLDGLCLGGHEVLDPLGIIVRLGVTCFMEETYIAEPSAQAASALLSLNHSPAWHKPRKAAFRPSAVILISPQVPQGQWFAQSI